jgi:hypothetical protein
VDEEVKTQGMNWMRAITQGRGGWVKRNRNRWRWEDIGTAAGRLIEMTKIEQILSAEEPRAARY